MTCVPFIRVINRCRQFTHPEYDFQAAVVGGWILFTILFWLCQLGEYYRPPPAVKMLYDIFVRDMFALCVAWLIFACCSGYGGEYRKRPLWKGDRIDYSVIPAALYRSNAFVATKYTNEACGSYGLSSIICFLCFFQQYSAAHLCVCYNKSTGYTSVFAITRVLITLLCLL